MAFFRPVFAALPDTVTGSGKAGLRYRSLARFTGLLLCLYLAAIHPSSAGTRQWTQIGPQAASMNALAIDPANPSVFYSASGHIISKSTDGGSSWSRLSEVPKSTTDYCRVFWLIIHPMDSALYAGTCEGVFKSTDGGVSWVAADNGIPTPGYSGKITADPTNESVLYILSNGLYKTIDGGANWTRLQAPVASTITIDPLSPSTLFIGSVSGGVYKSTDGGNSWNDSSTGIGGVNDIQISGNVLYAAGYSGVYKSVDDGSSWSLASNGMPSSGPGQPVVDQIAVAPGNPETVYAAVWGDGMNTIIYRSTDGGANWAVASLFELSQHASVLTVSPQDVSTVFAATSMGLAKSTDGASTWSYSRGNSGLPLAPTKVIGTDSAIPYNLYASGGGSYRSADKGKTWFLLNRPKWDWAITGSVSLAAVSKNYPGFIYGTNIYGFAMSSNYGLDWIRALSFFFPNPSVESVLDVASAPGVIYITSFQCAGLYGCFRSITKTSDSGITWNDLTNGIPPLIDGGAPEDLPLHMISDPGNPNIFYVGGSFGVYKTTNDCGVWGNSGSGLPAGTVSSLVMDPANPNVLYAAIGYSSSVPTGGGVYKSTDGAATWTAVNSGLTNLIVTSLAIDPTNPSNIHAGTDGGGVFRSTNGGASWTPVNSGLSGADSLSVNSIVLDAPGWNMFIGTNSGVYIYSFAPSVDVIEFYNTNLDHYFITADSNEAAAIDGGSAGPGWSRTGYTFKSGGDTPVCRFYGSQSPGPNSHFYTVDPGECNFLKELQASTPATEKRWNFESLDFFSTSPTNGACPSGTAPVYRAYNNGFARGVDSNHRITGSPAALQEVVARGWIDEGVVMCAPN